ncbi:MAG: hypothetical protein OXF54_02215 [Caldilineaceae bacterium]|nr:hypothetical protein [Caldilineaceae bacterium]
MDAKAAVGGDGIEFGFNCGDAVDQGSELPGRAGEGALFVLCRWSGRQQGEQREDISEACNAFHNGTFRYRVETWLQITTPRALLHEYTGS